MKNITVFFFALLLTTTTTFATAAVPPKPVWVTPENAAAGDEVQLHAFVFNTTSEAATVTVLFSVDNVTVATAQSVVIPGSTAKAATASWTEPTSKTTVTATVASALTSAKKAIPSLQGPVGTVVVADAGAMTLPDSTTVRGWSQSILGFFEAYRLKEVTYFTNLKEQSKEALGQTTLSEVGTLIHPDQNAAGQPSHTMEYVRYAYASAGKTFFSQKAVYYVALILAVLLIIRFIFSRLL